MADKTNSTSAEPTSQAAAPTKVEAVGRAMAALGEDASRSDIQSYVKQHFGYEMSIDHISNCKSQVQKKAGGSKGKKKSRRKAKKAPVAKAAAKTTPAPKAAAYGGSSKHGLTLKDVEITRDLLGRVGAAQLRSLIQLMTK
jgi:hypothetical protein